MTHLDDPLAIVLEILFDHANKWYMHNPESLLVNGTHKILSNSNIQTDNLISARRPDLVIINKKQRTCGIMDFVVPVDNRIKLKKVKKTNKFLDLGRELNKAMEQESDSDTYWKRCSWYCSNIVWSGYPTKQYA